jgi:D-alanyl-D-alanine carboxypeptidase/D-alanyl-D-alanine-endopeptidase (penicillin-binding protein 4)
MQANRSASGLFHYGVLLSVLLAGCLPGPRHSPAPSGLGAEIGAVFEDTAFSRAHWGVVVKSLQSGATLYERNGEKFFMPASNMKLVTGAAVLEALGPDYRYRTEISAAGPIRDGVLRGDLVVRGGGDPTISARFADGDPRAVFRAWADSLRAHGVRRISGAIVGIDSTFVDAPLGRGWAWDDLDAYYAAEAPGLQLNEGAVQVAVFPGSRPGLPGFVTLDPPNGYVRVLNHTTTVPAGTPPRIRFEREAAGPGIEVSGEIPADTSVTRDIAVRETPRFFVTVLREVLREAGISVDGPSVLIGDREEEGGIAGRPLPLFTHTSPPLREILPAMMKPSQNQIAEMLLKTLGRELRGRGSAEGGIAVVDSLFGTWGLQPGELMMADGSGLSRYNYLTPDLLIGLLERMIRSPNAEVWLASLPIAGVDGTLRNRLRDTPAEGHVRAKTGTISNTRALSGYVTTSGGERLVFSMIVNNSPHSSRDADRLVDTVLLRLVGAGAAAPTR